MRGSALDSGTTLKTQPQSWNKIGMGPALGWPVKRLATEWCAIDAWWDGWLIGWLVGDRSVWSLGWLAAAALG